jgi:ABC-type cobalt transport system substrate-binding protein
MSNRKKLLSLVGIAISLLTIMSCSSTYEESIFTSSDGTTNNTIVAVKDYEIVAPIRVTAEKVFNGSEWSGNEITYDLLLQKAYEMEADDVINIKIDTSIKTTKITENNNEVIKKTYNYIANGLAIKYTDALQVTPTPSLVSPLYSFDSSQIETNETTNKSFDWKGVSLITLGTLLIIGLSSE